MVDEILERIRRDSHSVTSDEISSTIKIAGAAPYIAGSLGLGAGALGTYLALARSEADQQLESDTKALLGGAVGAAGGFYLGKNKPNLFEGSPKEVAYGYSSPADISSSDMDYIYGR